MQVRAGLPSGPLARVLHPEPFFFRKAGHGLIDVSIWVLACIGAFLLRFDFALHSDMVPSMVATVALLVCVNLIATLALQLHRQSWAKITFNDARMLAFGIVGASIVAVVLLGVGVPTSDVPLSVPVLAGVLSTLMMVTARGFARYLDDRRRSTVVPKRRRRNVLIVGAGEAGSMLVREMQRHPEAGLVPVALVDDDRDKVGRTIGRVPVVGTTAQLKLVFAATKVDEVLIAVPQADGRQIRSIVDRIRAANRNVPYRTMPALHELLSGTVTVSRVREVGIDDLLRRPPIKLDVDSILGYLQGKTVMVTGAGGSIGSELVRQICRFAPNELVLFGHGENSIFQLERELDRDWPRVRYHSVIGAVQNVVRLDHIFRTLKPDVVFHAAAHKHVPLMELNPEEAVFNNVVGSRNLVNLALKYEVSHFVNISTDKAVNPTSVMGASKRLVEEIVEQASQLAKPGKVFTSVRFGNVLGSRGSAVPIFKQQIKHGGPVTITHPDMVRYFMTIPEATRLVLQASALGRNGEIFILDMGEPVRVLDLVKDLIRLSGLEPEVDIPITFTGVRPGEKLVEELMSEHELHDKTSHDKIFVAHPLAVDGNQLDRVVDQLIQAAMQSDGAEIRRLLGVGLSPATASSTTLGLSSQEPEERDLRNVRHTLN